MPHTSADAVLLAAEAFSRHDDIDQVHADLVRSGITDLEAAKLVLFVPSAFARESYEPDGIAFPDSYVCRSEDGATRRLSYAEEPIYQQSRVVARQFIASGRSGEIAAILTWSSEAKLVADGTRRGSKLVRVAEVMHEF